MSKKTIGIKYYVIIAFYIVIIAMFFLTLWKIPDWIYRYELNYVSNVEAQMQTIFKESNQSELKAALQTLRDEQPFEIAVYQDGTLVYRSIQVEGLNALRGTLQEQVIVVEAQGVIIGKAGNYDVWYAIYAPSVQSYINNVVALLLVYLVLSFITLLSLSVLLYRKMFKPLTLVKDSVYKLERYDFDLIDVAADDVINESMGRFAINLQGAIKAVSRNHTELEYALQSERERLANLMTVSRGLVHDLKSPLHQSLIENERYVRKLQAALPETMELAEYNINRYDELIRYVNNVLNLMDFDVREMTAIKDDFNLVSVFKDIRHSFNTYLRERSLLLVVEEPKRLDVHLNRVAIHLILHNMLSNAVKYALIGTEISFFLDEVDGAIEFMCVNEATSTDIERVRRSDELFYAIQDEHDRYSTGNGLYLIKELVKVVGGSYDVQFDNHVIVVRVSIPNNFTAS